MEASIAILGHRFCRGEDGGAAVAVAQPAAGDEEVEGAIHAAVVGDLDNDLLVKALEVELEAFTAVGLRAMVLRRHEAHPISGGFVQEWDLIRAHDDPLAALVARRLGLHTRLPHLLASLVAHRAVGDFVRPLAAVPAA